MIRSRILIFTPFSDVSWGKDFLKPPDNDLLQVIIAKCFYARQVRVPVKTIEFITNNIERSIKSAIRFVEYIDEKAIEQAIRNIVAAGANPKSFTCRQLV